jgi:[ribosomal protein S5]-alanine N-acetyltransferase
MLTTPYIDGFPVLSINSELCLRQPMESDAEILCAYYQEPEVGQYIMASNPDTLVEAKSELLYNKNLFKTRRGLFWSIATKDTDEMIGTVGLYSNNFHHRAELCYDLSKSHWRKGVMTEALSRVLDYCFEAGFMRIEAVTMTNNEASQAILKKLGFEFDSLMKNYRYYEGSFHDVNMYSITPKMWQATEFAGKKAEPTPEEEQLLEEMFA